MTSIPASAPAEYTVYTKPDCPNCDKVKAHFDRNGVTYHAVDITEVPAAFEYITEDLGYSQAPVIVNNADDEDHWAGARMDKLTQAVVNHKRTIAAASEKAEAK